MKMPKHHIVIIILLMTITTLSYLTIYQHQEIASLQTRNDTQYQRLMEYIEEDAQTEEVEEEKSLYELQQESGEYAPYNSSELYIPIDTPDQI